MALNLSTLTSPTTSGDVLAEMLTTADFLDPVPVLRNIARGPNKGGDAKQTTALNQPKALPLIKNPSGKLGGYLYIPNVSGNYATGPSVTIGANETWEAEVDMVVTQFGEYVLPMGGGDWVAGFGLVLNPAGGVRVFSKGSASSISPSVVTLGTPFNVKYGYGAIGLYVKINDIVVSQNSNQAQSSAITHTLQLAQQNNLTHVGNYAIQKAKLTVASSVVFECDFNGSTSIRHGATKFNAKVGGTVTINQSGNDPATVIKKSVLRFDGADDGFKGLFNQTIDSGYMFAAFSVLGDGGDAWGRIISVNKTGSNDYTDGGMIFGDRSGSTNNFATNKGFLSEHVGLFDSSNGDILSESKATQSATLSRVNNADAIYRNNSYTIEGDEFNIGNGAIGGENAAIDLEYLALFPATISDAEAARVVTYINTRNNVFDLKDGFGHYFYDGTKAPVGAISSGSASWNGRIVGSDNGDSDRYLTQATASNQPVSDGYKVTFADNTDFLTIPSTAQAGWQIVGTSLGTFAYRVNNSAQTELSLLGHLGHASFRKAGDLYGIMLLPETANGKEIEAARKLLIDRGASDGTTSTSLYTYWYGRHDIVEFKSVDLSNATNVSSAWQNCSLMTTFPALNLSGSVDSNYAWYGCANLSNFGAIQAPLCVNFTSAWQNSSALTSFPAGAKLGTAAENVNFASAFRSSGLTSFSTPLPTATNVNFTWLGCSSLTSFSSDLSSAATAYQAWVNCSSLESFTSALPLVTNAHEAWANCNSLESFTTVLPLVASVYQAWYGCASLTDFPSGVFANWNPASISSGVFNNAWFNCTSLTAQSVENILVSINASGHYATTNKVSGGSALADAGIDIDYNVATGALSAATNSAIDSLSGKGWEVFINGVLVIPNILDLAPALAYSLRSFDSSADPNVVNVRRSSDSATSNFKASEVSDGTLTTWVGSGNDGYVTTWYDQGGTNHAAQATASSQPKIVESGVLVTEGGLPALDFDSVDDYLDSTSNISSPFWSFITHKATKDNSVVFSAKSNDRWLGRRSTGAFIQVLSSVISGGSYPSSAVIRMDEVNGSDSKIFSNGTSIVTGDSGSAQSDFGRIGAQGQLSSTKFLGGNIQELIVYITDQSAKRTGIEKNINDTYTIY